MQENTIIEPVKLTSLQKRKLRRKKAKIAELREAARLRETNKRSRVVTYSDLDEYQLEGYSIIKQWWDTQKKIGGVARPLVISGVGGAGKTSLISVALPDLQTGMSNPVRIAYCAPTGKAASVMISKGLDASTIHSLIYHCTTQEDKFEFELKDKEEVPFDLIVADEASMIPDDIRKDLESLKIPLIYVGDGAQLPPVTGKGNIMDRATIKLMTPHRSALEGGIIQMCTDIRNGEKVEKGVYGKDKAAYKVGRDAIDDIKLLASADVVICHTNKTRHSLNKRIRKFKNYDGKYPEIGERLICIRNNKDTGMFNGLMVYVTAVEIVGEFLRMDLVDEMGNEYNNRFSFTNYFDGEDHPKIMGSCSTDLFEFGYAITCHKSQGSEFSDVVFIEESMSREKFKFKRSWLYTAASRASERVTWISKFK